MAVEVGYFDSTRLIPDLKFTCSGTIMRVRVAGRPQQDSNQSMRLQIWRRNVTERTGKFKRINSIVLPSACEKMAYKMLMMTPGGPNSNMMFQQYECTLKQNISVLVKTGDILGIELPSEHSSFKLSANRHHMLTNFIIEHNLSASTIDLHPVSELINETAAQPLIMIELEADQGM